MSQQFKVLTKVNTIGQQSITRLEHLQFGEHKLRLTIKSDSYKFQSYATLEVLNKATMEWSKVVYRPHSDMVTQEGLVYRPDVQRMIRGGPQLDFITFVSADRKWLLDAFKALAT